MSSNSTIIDEDYVPVKNTWIDIHEIKSKYTPRYFVLVDQQSQNISKLGVKDFFLWENIDSEKTIAELKQEYYQKFKTIPSQRIMDLVRELYETGFLESDDAVNESFPYTKAFGVIEGSFSVAFLRNTFGHFSGFLHSVPLAIGLCLLIPIFMGLAFYSTGSGLLFSCLELGSAVDILKTSIATAYGITVLRLLMRLGILVRKPVYIGDRAFIGLFFLIPYLRINTRGFLLKPSETRLVNQIYLWVMPLLISSASFCYSSFFLEKGTDIHFVFSAIGLASFLDFIITSCPFYRSCLVRIFDEISEDIPVYQLMAMYLKDSYQFSSENSIKHRKLLQVYLSSIFVWVVLGSSFLLITTARFTDNFSLEIKNLYQLSSANIEIVQWILYTPILSSFVFLFWKLIQPFVGRIIQNKIWGNQYILASTLSCLAVCFGGLFILLPPLLGRSLLIIFLAVCLQKNSKIIKNLPLYLRVHFIVQVVSVVLLVGSLFRPNLTPFILVLGLLWLIWHGITCYAFSPKSNKWIAKLSLTAILFSAVYSIAPIYLNYSPSICLFTFCAGLATANLFWFFSGHVTIHFIHSLFIQMGLFFIYDTYETQPELSGILICTVLLLMQFQSSAMSKATKKCLALAPSELFKLEETSRASIEGSLSNFVGYCLGTACLKNISDKKINDLSVLRHYESWLKRWMVRRHLLQSLKFALGSVPWDERQEWGERLGNAKVSSLEKKSKLDVKSRMKILHSQLVFKGFSASEMELLVQQFEVNVYHKDQYITRQGDRTHPWLEIIVSGQAVMQKKSNNGNVSILAELGSMDAIRSDDLFKDANYDATISCMKDTFTVRLYRKHFEKWGEDNPELLLKVLDSMQLAKMIMSLSLFRDFSMAQMRVLMGQLKKDDVAAGEDIITEGDVGDKFYLLDSGNVDVLIGSHKVASLGEGSYFGEIALLEKCKRTATIRSSEKCVIYSLEQHDFDRFFAGGRSAQVLKNISSSRVESLET